MQIIATLNAISGHRALRYLVIGGHAINARGFGRTTKDLDIVVPLDTRSVWKEEIVKLGYSLFHEESGFMQFSVPDLEYWPLNIMLVNSETFEKLWEAGDEIDLGGTTARIASVMHLIPMKLHTPKGSAEERWPKDIADILELSRLEGLDLQSPEFRQLCERYGTIQIYERILQFKSK